MSAAIDIVITNHVDTVALAVIEGDNIDAVAGKACSCAKYLPAPYNG